MTRKIVTLLVTLMACLGACSMVASTAEANWYPLHDGLMDDAVHNGHNFWAYFYGYDQCEGGLWLQDDLPPTIVGITTWNTCNATRFNYGWWYKQREQELPKGGIAMSNALYRICEVAAHELGHRASHPLPDGGTTMPMRNDAYSLAIGWFACDDFVRSHGGIVQ